MGLPEFFIIGVIMCIFLNLLVIAIQLSKGGKMNCIDLLMISLSTCDLFQAIIGYSLEIDWAMRGSEIEPLECQIIGFTVAFLGLVSISHLAGIAVQRCVILQNPIRARAWSTKYSTAWYVIIPSWLYGLFWALPPLLGWSSYRPLDDTSPLCGPALTQDEQSGRWSNMSYLNSLLIFCFMIPILTIAVCSFFVYSSLKNMRQLGQLLGLGAPALLERRKREKRQCLMGAVMIGAFVIAWSPYASCVLLIATGSSVSSLLLQAAAVTGKSSCIFNPIIYSFFVDDFRERCKKILKCERITSLMETTISIYRNVSGIVRRAGRNNSETCAEYILTEYSKSAGFRSRHFSLEDIYKKDLHSILSSYKRSRSLP